MLKLYQELPARTQSAEIGYETSTEVFRCSEHANPTEKHYCRSTSWIDEVNVDVPTDATLARFWHDFLGIWRGVRRDGPVLVLNSPLIEVFVVHGSGEAVQD